MKKSYNMLIILVVIMISGCSNPPSKNTIGTKKNVLLFNEGNGILNNQKYVCINSGYLVSGTYKGLTGQEKINALKYPVRFFINDRIQMIQDNGSVLYYTRKTSNIMGFKDSNNKEMLVSVDKFGKKLIGLTHFDSIPAQVIYVCTETENWTLSK